MLDDLLLMWASQAKLVICSSCKLLRSVLRNIEDMGYVLVRQDT